MMRPTAVSLCDCPAAAPEPRSLHTFLSSWFRTGLAAGLIGLWSAAGIAADPVAGDRRSASQVYRERTGTLILERARANLLEGRSVEGVQYLQQLLDGPSDSFVATDAGLVGARSSATTLLNTLSGEALRLYRNATTPLAAAMLQEAIAEQDLDRLGEVVRRFPATDPAFRALDRLASIAFDRGDVGTAARLWGEMLSDSRYAGRVTPSIVARALVAMRRAGRDGQVSELAVRFSGTTLHVAGEPTTIGALLRRTAGPPEATASTGRADTITVGLVPPAFPPAWHRQGATAGDLGDLWASSRRSDARPLAAAAGAVLLDNLLVTREAGGLAVYEIGTGKPLGHHPLTAVVKKLAESDARNLHDLTQFEDCYAGNSVLGGISTDGERVFVIDRSPGREGEIRTVSHSPVPAYEQRPEGDSFNRLLAFTVSADGNAALATAWIAGQTAAPGSPEFLGDHFFYGPPVVVDGTLLAITERRQCLSLVALDPESGDLLWQQPLGYVPRDVATDPVRAASSAAPAVYDGIAVCQTNAGFVVAVDLVTRRLLWAYDYAATETESTATSGWAPNRTDSHGDLAFASVVLVKGENAVVLPQDSDRIHCIDLRTGRLNWTAPREDAFFVACLTESSAVVVGRSFCRSLSLLSGSVQWETRLGSPAGTGLATPGLYLLPLENGLVAGIDLASGHKVGFDTPRDAGTFQPLAEESKENDLYRHWQPGNLLTGDGAIFSVGPFGVTRLATAESVLAAQPAELEPLEVARIELAAGKLDEARIKLEPLATADADDPRKTEARRLLRELHYLRLDWQATPDGDGILAELDTLSDTPQARGRFLLTAVNRTAAAGTDSVLRRRVEEFSRLGIHRPLPSPGDPTLLVTAASWVPSVVDRFDDEKIETVAYEPIADLGRDELRRRLLFSRSSEQKGEIGLELARRAVRDGEFHQAETLLLQAARQEGFAEDAFRALEQLRRQCGLAVVTADQDYPSVEQVRITNNLWKPASDALCQAFGRSRRGFLTRWREPLRIVDRGDSRRARLSIVNLGEGITLGELTLDARLRFPSLSRQPLMGHFLPVATTDRLYGLSMLEAHRGEPAWQVELPGNDGLLPQLGPYGATFCTVQTRRELTVLNPATGEIIWQRTELPPDRGLHGDHAAGLFGDHEALVLLDADGLSYTVFKTQTGEQLSRGRLPIDHRRQRAAFGRRLFYVDTTGAESVARLWDPLTGRDDLEIPFTGLLQQTVTRDDQLVLLFADGRLMIIDPVRAEVAIDLRLEPAQVGRSQAIKAFRDREHYYLCFNQADPDRFDERRFEYVYDTPLSTTQMQGRLVAIDRETGTVAWSRLIDQRSVFDSMEEGVPFLVAIARVTDPRVENRKTLLVEAIDKRTGVVLGRNETLLPDQILQVRTLPEKGRLELAGMTSTVVLDFGRNPNKGPALAGAAR